MIDLNINDLYIEAGAYGYTLKQKKMVKDSKTGELKENYVQLSYHGNLEATLTAALFCGLAREDAVKYSFLLSLPTIVAAAALEILDVLGTGLDTAMLLPYAVGCVVAAVTGYLAIGMVRMISKNGKLKVFSFYCAALALGLFASYLF